MHVMCTAGHVDHGKSTLVEALTGMQPDRFAEEQRRGLTIDIGFAWTALDTSDGTPPVTVSFVDLPGHHRFIGNMLAGAGPVGAALFVIAADEGWMPQTQEHLEILNLLGVRHGVVALTKVDLVDDETREVAVELVQQELAGTTLEQAPIVPVSARTGEGIEDLRERIAEALSALGTAVDRGRPRLWVDRSFTVHGAGTVVTGTLTGGWLRKGDEVAVLPGSGRGRIRGLQSLKHEVDEAAPGSRVAVNVSGLATGEVPRGSAIVRPGQWLAVQEFDARVQVLPGQELDRRGDWHVHVGSGVRGAVLIPLEPGTLHSSSSEPAFGYVRVELDQPAALVAGDSFILRESGRRATVAGGVVLDPDPPRRPRGTSARLERMSALEDRGEAIARGEPAALVRMAVAERDLVPLQRAAAAAGITRDKADEVRRQADIVAIEDAIVGRKRFERWAKAILADLRAFHHDEPVRRAAPKAVATAAAVRAGCPRNRADAVLAAMAERGLVVAEGTGVRAPDHRVQMSEADRRAREELLGILNKDLFSPPHLDEVAAAAGASPALVQELELGGDIVRIEPDIAVSASAITEAHRVLSEAFAKEGPLSASRAKELLGTTRKYALPLLQQLDRMGRTRREGDVRVVQDVADG